MRVSPPAYDVALSRYLAFQNFIWAAGGGGERTITYLTEQRQELNETRYLE